jgi:peptidoglycan/xylan/chitin deacetylase (PgdA/CDA1 family)
MNARVSTLFGLRAIAVLVALAVPFIGAAELSDLPPPIEVFVRNHQHFVPRTTTFGQAVEAYHVHARSGNLLDVDGNVIRDAAFPGRVVLNGDVVPPSTRLHDHDRIWVVNRSSQVEALARRVLTLRGRRPGNPQFYLGTAPGVQIITTGKVSGRLVSSVFEPTGPSHTPPAVALTFDDGPNSEYTPRILSILKRMHVHATFFTIGYLVERYPDLVRREKRAGMVVADHSWDHPNSPPFQDLSPHRIHSEMFKAKLALDGLGVDAELFRPPGGSTSVEVETIAKELGMRVVLWSVDPEDWRAGVTWKQIVKNVLSNVRPGSIVIMHDGGGDQSATVRALPKIIRGIRRMHLKFLTIR